MVITITEMDVFQKNATLLGIMCQGAVLIFKFLLTFLFLLDYGIEIPY